uniref:Uncharacterized protein n=1 Tax=Anguilla anguilla TaxID=7936 RepID=A0A0E9Q5D6_ANGAN
MQGNKGIVKVLVRDRASKQEAMGLCSMVKSERD